MDGHTSKSGHLNASIILIVYTQHYGPSTDALRARGDHCIQTVCRSAGPSTCHEEYMDETVRLKLILCIHRLTP